jgi:hypothetical protein
MNEYQATKKYLQTLKQVYQEKGIKATIKHELISIIGSMVGRYARLNNYVIILTSESGPDSKDFRLARESNQKIKTARLENILNPNLSSDLWASGHWTETVL